MSEFRTKSSSNRPGSLQRFVLLIDNFLNYFKMAICNIKALLLMGAVLHSLAQEYESVNGSNAGTSWQYSGESQLFNARPVVYVPPKVVFNPPQIVYGRPSIASAIGSSNSLSTSSNQLSTFSYQNKSPPQQAQGIMLSYPADSTASQLQSAASNLWSQTTPLTPPYASPVSLEAYTSSPLPSYSPPASPPPVSYEPIGSSSYIAAPAVIPPGMSGHPPMQYPQYMTMTTSQTTAEVPSTPYYSYSSESSPQQYYYTPGPAQTPSPYSPTTQAPYTTTPAPYTTTTQAAYPTTTQAQYYSTTTPAPYTTPPTTPAPSETTYTTTPPPTPYTASSAYPSYSPAPDSNSPTLNDVLTLLSKYLQSTTAENSASSGWTSGSAPQAPPSSYQIPTTTPSPPQPIVFQYQLASETPPVQNRSPYQQMMTPMLFSMMMPPQQQTYPAPDKLNEAETDSYDCDH